MEIKKRDGLLVEFDGQKIMDAILKAFICASVKSSATMQGTSFNPNLLAANILVCPVTITLFLSIIIGTLNPNSLMEAATLSMASLLFLGLFTYGIILLMSIFFTSITSPFIIGLSLAFSFY